MWVDVGLPRCGPPRRVVAAWRRKHRKNRFSLMGETVDMRQLARSSLAEFIAVFIFVFSGCTCACSDPKEIFAIAMTVHPQPTAIPSRACALSRFPLTPRAWSSSLHSTLIMCFRSSASALACVRAVRSCHHGSGLRLRPCLRRPHQPRCLLGPAHHPKPRYDHLLRLRGRSDARRVLRRPLRSECVSS